MSEKERKVITHGVKKCRFGCPIFEVKQIENLVFNFAFGYSDELSPEVLDKAKKLSSKVLQCEDKLHQTEVSELDAWIMAAEARLAGDNQYVEMEKTNYGERRKRKAASG